METTKGKNTIAYILGSFLFLVIAGGGYYLYTLNMEMADLKRTTDETQARLEENIATLEQQNTQLQEANVNLREELTAEQELTEDLEDELADAKGEVKTFKTLEKIDPELLKKYSSVYFLNENYEPRALTAIDKKYLAPQREEARFHKDAWPFLEDLLEDAYDDGVKLTIVSGYRAFDEQSDLKAKYNVLYGEHSANQFSANQGYSEHQLGTTVDFSMENMNGSLSGFDQTTGYAWLLENAHEYGFVISYPVGNSSFQFEPWHWRFVGEELADDLHDDNMFFYDMDQRKIDGYRLELFD